MQGTQVQSLGREDPLEKEMAAHSSILAMDRGAWQATVHGAAESDTAEGLTLSGSFAVKGAKRVGDAEKVRVREIYHNMGARTAYLYNDRNDTDLRKKFMFQERGQFQERQREQDQVQPFSDCLVMKNHVFPFLCQSPIFLQNTIQSIVKTTKLEYTVTLYMTHFFLSLRF